MNNKNGFSLIELMIALTIGAMIITGLFSTLYQVGTAQNSVDTTTDAHQQAAIIFNHLERDLMGAFIPEQVDPLGIKKKEAADQQENKAKSLEYVFWGKARDDKNMQFLTCITNNPLEIYLGIKNAQPKSRIARVIYRLEPQKGFKDSFVLSRQEGTELSYALYKKQADKKKIPPAYQMVDNIASLAITYLALDTSQEKKADTVEQRAYKKTKDWLSDKKSEKNKGIQYALPEWVEITLALWDNAHEKKFNFAYTIPIMFKKGKPSRVSSPPQQKKPMQVAQKKKQNVPPPPALNIDVDGSKVIITQDEKGNMIIAGVPA